MHDLEFAFMYFRSIITCKNVELIQNRWQFLSITNRNCKAEGFSRIENEWETSNQNSQALGLALFIWL